jgi:hypothetical protein
VDDNEIHGRIEELVAEEHRIWESEASGSTDEEARRRLDAIGVSLEQWWDLLRQRRALREAGRDPDEARIRDPETFDRYQQ